MMPWANCHVTSAGPAEDGTIFVSLRADNGWFPDSWFSAVPNMKEEILTTALTAISTGKGVQAALSNFSPYSVIERLYVNR
jgi:hypothetical protein